MIIRPLFSIIAATIFMTLSVLSAASQGTETSQGAAKTDKLGVPGPVNFEGQNYELATTTHPQPNYFKQEYLPAGQGPDTYTRMFLIETLTSGASPKDAAASQIA